MLTVPAPRFSIPVVRNHRLKGNRDFVRKIAIWEICIVVSLTHGTSTVFFSGRFPNLPPPQKKTGASLKKTSLTTARRHGHIKDIKDAIICEKMFGGLCNNYDQQLIYLNSSAHFLNFSCTFFFAFCWAFF